MLAGQSSWFKRYQFIVVLLSMSQIIAIDPDPDDAVVKKELTPVKEERPGQESSLIRPVDSDPSHVGPEQVAEDQQEEKKRSKRGGRSRDKADLTIAEWMQVFSVFGRWVQEGQVSSGKKGNRLLTFDFLPPSHQHLWSQNIWHKLLKSDEDNWEAMVQDKALEKELGAGWAHKRSQTPKTWTTRLHGNAKKTKDKKAFVERTDYDIGEDSRSIVEEFKHLHELCRDAGEPWEAEDSVETLREAIAHVNEARVSAGKKPLPHKGSIGYVYVVERLCGLKDEAVGSLEERRVTKDDARAFEEFVNKTMKDYAIQLKCVVSHDEFREDRARSSKRVRTSAKERAQRLKGMQARLRKWAKQTSSGRLSHTCGVYLAPILGIVEG